MVMEQFTTTGPPGRGNMRSSPLHRFFLKLFVVAVKDLTDGRIDVLVKNSNKRKSARASATTDRKKVGPLKKRSYGLVRRVHTRALLGKEIDRPQFPCSAQPPALRRASRRSQHFDPQLEPRLRLRTLTL